MPNIIPNLWFDSNAEEAARFYVSIFPNSEVLTTTHYTEAGPGEPGTVLTVEFVLDGTKFVGINGGPIFSFDEAISFQIDCRDQSEIDYYWDALTADGGEESQCGWLKDRFGLSWQVCPDRMGEFMNDPDRAKVERVTRALYEMKKIDLAALDAAAAAS
jgi:predicted 3-demethylubiquinone-9 3-methyltransferase (glyoxalase superfamily)